MGILSKEEKEEIKILKKEKRFDDIYYKYGQDVFFNNVEKSYLRKDVKKLIREGKFIDIYNKYGEDVYKKHLRAMKKIDKRNEKYGKDTSIVPFYGNSILRKIRNIIIYLTAGTTATFATFGHAGDKMKSKDIEENSSKVEEYINDVKEYSENFKNVIRENNLNDVEIFMKLIDDMWKEIEGYKNPENSIMGASGVTLKYEKVGVCINFSDDIARKLNCINPDYNARVFITNLEQDDAKAEISDVDRNIIKSNETVVEENSNKEEKKEEMDSFTESFVNNHAIVILDVNIDGKSISMFLDPTNLFVGVYRNGKIETFNTDKSVMSTRSQLGKVLIEGNSDYLNDIGDYLKSFLTFISDEEYKKLNETFGVDAQNRALEKVRSIEDNTLKNSLKTLTNEIIEIDGRQIIFEENTKEDIEKYENLLLFRL